ncbi:hypothetical protein EM6_0881 [Asticcacaulis excentricus]|uniref:Uncharacterized protein n=1 Tax=Asticcacaulis excentricus TaxID=78587 RepID=A0A3G9FYV3_9CAUL|nr:hypothetical protein EM6_0881 [Asticcacaulis excentricus]
MERLRIPETGDEAVQKDPVSASYVYGFGEGLDGFKRCRKIL